jgi:hypothetical protein
MGRRRIGWLGVGFVIGLFAVVSKPAGASRAGIPPSVRTALLADATRVAALDDGPHPYDIQAVSTTFAKAQRVTCGSCTGLGKGGTHVYVVAMRGHFACNTCHHLFQNEPIGRGTVILLEYSSIAAPLQWTGFELRLAYPNLRLAGTPVRLDRAVRHRPSNANNHEAANQA